MNWNTLVSWVGFACGGLALLLATTHGAPSEAETVVRREVVVRHEAAPPSTAHHDPAEEPPVAPAEPRWPATPDALALSLEQAFEAETSRTSWGDRTESALVSALDDLTDLVTDYVAECRATRCRVDATFASGEGYNDAIHAMFLGEDAPLNLAGEIPLHVENDDGSLSAVLHLRDPRTDLVPPEPVR